MKPKNTALLAQSNTILHNNIPDEALQVMDAETRLLFIFDLEELQDLTPGELRLLATVVQENKPDEDEQIVEEIDFTPEECIEHIRERLVKPHNLDRNDGAQDHDSLDKRLSTPLPEDHNSDLFLEETLNEASRN